jgi:tetratricopeptide (TPR) repeat protein
MTKQRLAISNCFVFAARLLFLIVISNSPALATDRPASASDLEKLQEQVRGLDKDVTVLKETASAKLDAQDKRISDLSISTAQQGNHLSAISTQTGTVANYIAITSIVITILVFSAGFITYVSATRKAKEEARRWFEEQAVSLREKIKTLEEQASKAADQISAHGIHVAQLADDTSKKITEAGALLLQQNSSTTTGVKSQEQTDAANIVKQATDALKRKPESQFTSEDHYAKGLDYYRKGDFQSAFESFDAALASAEKANASEHDLVGLLLAKGIALGQLNRLADEIVAYDEIDRRYKEDTRPEIREQVAMALFNKGVSLGQLFRSKEAIAVYDEIDRRYKEDTRAEIREQVAKALYAKGASLGQLNRSEEAIAVYEEVNHRYKEDTRPEIREQVATAWNGMGFCFLMQAKQKWIRKDERTKLLGTTIEKLQAALTSVSIVKTRAVILGNLGYCFFLSGKSTDAIAPTKECLLLGGQKSFDEQKTDAKQHRVEPEDTQYEALLDKLWAELKTKG